MAEPIKTPLFREALSKVPAATASLPTMTLWRYTNGLFPKSLRWLLRHPQLLRALAEDAERQQTTPAATGPADATA